MKWHVLRHLLKAVIYRALRITTNFLIIYLFTRSIYASMSFVLSLSISLEVVGTLTYYVFEEVWDEIKVKLEKKFK